ncbi:MAG: hypothetical protein ABIT38_10465, partial [Gemmatimonadaceae bacterium]
AAPFGRATLVVLLRDSLSRAPIPGASVSVTWMSTIGRVAGDSARVSAEGVTSDAGVAALCAVPAGQTHTIMVARGGATPAPTRRVEVRAREVRMVTIDLPK